MRKRNILVFPAGTEIGLEIFAALQFCKEVRIFGAGQDISNPARFIFPCYHVIPPIYDRDWVSQLTLLCKNLEIEYIFPAYDDVIVALNREAQHFPAKIISSPPETCEITRSKSLTYQRLAPKVRVPAVYRSMGDVPSYPVIVKPDRGQGSIGVTRVDRAADLERVLSSVTNPIICEFLPGDEFTVDCFSDRQRGLLFAGARRRRRTRNGIAVNTITETLPEAEKMATEIGAQLGLRGAWFFQVKRASDGQLVLLEVAPRIAGSMAAHRVHGVNFPLLSIFEEERQPVHIRPNTGTIELDRALGNRYRHSIEYSVLYVDLDDTLIVGDQVNLQIVKLVFQCVNRKRKVVLLTRHDGDVNHTLEQHRLVNLFCSTR